ncbi:IPT/TIG domain-containing protein [Bacteroides ovatus]|nr:IPT/TIG domain-containing protein [Bacteroides ovatus]
MCFIRYDIHFCADGDFGANPYDPNTPDTVSQLPKVLSFTPTEGKEGDVITITGVNFTTATNVAFGGKVRLVLKLLMMLLLRPLLVHVEVQVR